MTASWPGLAQHLLRPDPNDSPVRWAEYQALTETDPVRGGVQPRIRPFSLPLAGEPGTRRRRACGRPAPSFESHRPPPISLAQ